MYILLRILPICVTLFLSVSAQAAYVSGIRGDVYVNRGGGYQQIEGQAGLNAGDSVMAGTTGRATLDYGDGCVIELTPGSVVAIGQISPCAIETGSNPTSSQGLDMGTLGVGALVVGGVVGGVILLSDDDDKGGGSGSGSSGPGSGVPASP